MSREGATWKAVALLSSIAGAVAARGLIKTTWRKALHEDPPLNPASPETGWKEAVSWTAAVGVAAGLARLFARRGAATAWSRVMGRKPPVSMFSK